MANRFSDIALQFHDNTGAVLSGGLLYFYLTGTSTASDTYSDAGLTTPNANPVVLDSAGRAGNIFLDPTVTYRAVLKDSTEATTFWTKDSINTVLDADLTALGDNATNGLWARTGSGTGAARTITAGTDVSVANGDGVAGNPTVSLSSNVAKKDADNSFTAAQTVTVAAAGNAFNVVSTDAGAAVGPTLVLYRNSPSPANSDVGGQVAFDVEDSDGNQDRFGQVFLTSLDVTSGSEDGQISLSTVQSGALSARVLIAGGVFHGLATGGDKGNNTINFGAVYDDNVLLTCPALRDEFLTSGTVDINFWDAQVPDQIEPSRVERVPVVEMVEIEKIVHRRRDGIMIATMERRTVKRSVMNWVPIYDEHGNGLDAFQEEVVETVTIPAKVIHRQHAVARLFKRMIDDGFDPRDPTQYIAKMKTDGALPGMPTVGDWQHASLSLGEIHSRLWLAVEMLALAFAGLETRVSELEKAA